MAALHWAQFTDPVERKKHSLRIRITAGRKAQAELEEIEKQAAEEAAPKQAELERLEVQLLNLVKAHGSAHAEKSKLLHGIAWEVMATFGSSTSTDNAALERFTEDTARLVGPLL